VKLIFINTAYPQEYYSQLKLDTNNNLQIASNAFQWAVIDGLEQNEIDYTLACTPALPAYPRYKNLFTPRGEMSVNGKIRGHYLKYCDLPAIKQLSVRRVLRNYISKWCEQNKYEDKLIALVYTQNVSQMGAAIDLKKKYSNLIVAPIVTDLIDNAMDFAANHSLLKCLQVKLEAKGEKKLFPNVDKYILLTSQMTDCIPEAEGKYIVVEGIASEESIISHTEIKKDDEIRTLLYTGTFQEFGGVKFLIEAFRKTTNPKFRLVLCGNGVLKEYVEKSSKEDARIVYKGRLERTEIIKLQQKATLLINPRRPNGGITKYSFPSKTMEYMASMTPMIGYHLEGIPMEYHEQMYIPNDLSVEALENCINETLSMPLNVLQDKAIKAKDFISQNKTSKIQIKKIIDFIVY
jgi:glycosyltransferase involved in cell wall biosynthesis